MICKEGLLKWQFLFELQLQGVWFKKKNVNAKMILHVLVSKTFDIRNFQNNQ